MGEESDDDVCLDGLDDDDDDDELDDLEEAKQESQNIWESPQVKQPHQP